MGTPQLFFAANCGRLSRDRLATLVELIEEGPFGPVHTLIDDSSKGSGEPAPYVPGRLMSITRRRAKWNLTLFGETDDEEVTISLLQQRAGAHVAVTVSSARLRTEYGLFLRYARAWIAALPEVAHGRIYDSDCDIVGLYRELELDQPPPCFSTHLRWVHFLGPRYYPLFLETDDLLATPVREVEMLDEGVIQLMLADSPFAFDGEAGRQSLVRVTRYLNDRDHFVERSLA